MPRLYDAFSLQEGLGAFKAGAATKRVLTPQTMSGGKVAAGIAATAALQAGASQEGIVAASNAALAAHNAGKTREEAVAAGAVAQAIQDQWFPDIPEADKRTLANAIYVMPVGSQRDAAIAQFEKGDFAGAKAILNATPLSVATISAPIVAAPAVYSSGGGGALFTSLAPEASAGPENAPGVQPTTVISQAQPPAAKSTPSWLLPVGLCLAAFLFIKGRK